MLITPIGRFVAARMLGGRRAAGGGRRLGDGRRRVDDGSRIPDPGPRFPGSLTFLL